MWGSCGETRLLTLQKLQNGAARIVTNSSYDARADALIGKLNWPTISEIIKRETMIMIYESLNGLVPMYLSNIFSRNSTRDTVYLRNSESDLRVPLFKTANGQKSFAYRAAHLWNNLESEVKKHPIYLYLNIDFDTLLFLMLFFYYLSFVIRVFTFIVYISIAF